MASIKEAWHLLLDAARSKADGPIDLQACSGEAETAGGTEEETREPVNLDSASFSPSSETCFGEMFGAARAVRLAPVTAPTPRLPSRGISRCALARRPATVFIGTGAHCDGHQCDDYVRIRAVHDDRTQLHGAAQNPQEAGSEDGIQTGIEVEERLFHHGDTEARRHGERKN
jgi:hypothetical protein